jgi:hypothetical protein
MTDSPASKVKLIGRSPDVTGAMADAPASAAAVVGDFSMLGA